MPGEGNEVILEELGHARQQLLLRIAVLVYLYKLTEYS